MGIGAKKSEERVPEWIGVLHLIRRVEKYDPSEMVDRMPNRRLRPSCCYGGSFSVLRDSDGPVATFR